MYVKICSCIFILCGGVGMGFHLSYMLTMRVTNLKLLLRMAILLRVKIQAQGSSLPDCCLDIQKKLPEPFSNFLRELANKMKKGNGESLPELIEEGIQNNFIGIGFAKQDLDLIRELGNQLGFLNRENQIQQLKIFEKELEYFIDQVQKELPEKKKMVQSMGMIGGLFLIVVFL